MTPETRREVAIGGFLVAFGGAAVTGAAQIPPGVQTDPLGPGAFPAALGAGIAACGVLVGVTALLFSGPAGRAGLFADAGPVGGEEAGPVSPGRLAGAIVATAGYLAAFEPVGYLVATPIYVAAILAIHGGASRLAWVSAPVLVTAALYAAFQYGLRIPVPKGVLETVLPW